MKVFYIKIDETDGMDAISLVQEPAVQFDFLKFNKDNKISLSFNEEKHIISGVVCLADTPIYRYTEGIGEWYCIFTKDVIEKMIRKYSKDNLWNSINLQHNDDMFVDGIYMVESYLINHNRGICPKEFSDVPDGSWIASFYVENEDLWKDIKNGNELNGFSLQGYFELIPKEDDELDTLIDEMLN